ncbi:hypothetical protein A8C75_01820 [Marinobacterium aestuarii]|uniref:Uncharacterized protein n=1 Tax=Marinobacterium aestuarii TaxID=1821621 RepID=A0A1A9EUW1_9GAMM|nr:hypothetical protein [Marinobacterium aestuarii]ANG61323.1 hypothetical protein A8C75_01820 [Marinobacterium aestuarii]
MPAPEQDLLLQLDQQLQQAIETRQVEVYGQPSHLYHSGYYSNSTSLWSHSPALLEHQNRGYLITATPKAALRLAILPVQAIIPLLRTSITPEACEATAPPTATPNRLEDIGPGLERLCTALESYCPSIGLDGFATLALEGGNHYRHVLLFRPLDSLQLYDIEPL